MNFLCGNSYKKISSNILDETGFYKTPNTDNDIYFVKTDYIEEFFNSYLPTERFKLITHNSDFPINQTHIKYLNNKNVINWYASEFIIDHDKLKYIPIGLPNERIIHENGPIEHYHFGSRKVFSDIVFDNQKKSKMFAELAIDINTHADRKICVDVCNSLGYTNKKLTYEQYIIDLKKSMFCISPRGNGIIPHRIWECLYLKCIPVIIISNSISLFYKKLPVILLDSWDQLLTTDLNNDVYNKYMKSFDIKNLDEYYFLKEVYD